jgi:GNAT superfamily N-acetyltransferase
MILELRLVSSPEDWEAYHAIRERVLWQARGRPGGYDRLHPDERKEGNFPHLLLTEAGEPIGTVRIDVIPPVAWLRRVAIREDRQRQGYGRKMLELAAEFARSCGCRQLRSNVADDAVGFYRKLGFDAVVAEAATTSVPMARPL